MPSRRPSGCSRTLMTPWASPPRKRTRTFPMTESNPPIDDQGAAQDTPQGEIIAKPATYYRMTRLVMALAFIGMGAWFGYDGWIGTDPADTDSTDISRRAAS